MIKNHFTKQVNKIQTLPNITIGLNDILNELYQFDRGEHPTITKCVKIDNY